MIQLYTYLEASDQEMVQGF